VTTRTTLKTVRFTQPFRLGGIDEIQPPGAYDVTTDEEQIGGMTTSGWRRVATTILLSRDGATQSRLIDPVDLEASLRRDKDLIVPPTGRM
jgi:hypothetical protein